MLNLDIANRVVFGKSLSVEELIRYVLKSNRDYNSSYILLKERHHCNVVDEKIKNLKIQYEKPYGNKIDYQVMKRMPVTSGLKMKSKSGEEYTI